jgi:porphobilinogen deaminase
MAKKELTDESVDLLNTLVDALSGKKEKKAKKAKARFVIIVDGQVSSQMATKKKEVVEAATALILRALANGCKAPVVTYAEVTNEIAIDVPVLETTSKGIEVQS